MSMSVASRFRSGLAILHPQALRLARVRCPFCGPSVFVRLNDRDWGARCVRCAASAVHVALGHVLRERIADISALDACEFSARGPLVAYLKKHARSLAVSEYLEGVAPGATCDGVRCEDMQQLSYADASFDVITHTEVLEHVPDDRRAFAELHRVLRPGGLMLFTVPLHGGERTIERARLCDGVIEHLHPPVLHGDPLRGGVGILAFRDYGRDILERLRSAGFARAHLHVAQSKASWLPMREVVLACKENR